MAYLRQDKTKVALVASGRFFYEFTQRSKQGSFVGDAWKNTWLVLPDHLKDLKFTDIFTQAEVAVSQQRQTLGLIPLWELFKHMPASIAIAQISKANVR